MKHNRDLETLALDSVSYLVRRWHIPVVHFSEFLDAPLQVRIYMKASKNLFRTNWTILRVAVIVLLSLFICHPAICQTHQTATAANSSAKIKLLQNAAEKGDARSQCMLGISCMLGKGAPQNQTKAIYLARLRLSHALFTQFTAILCRR
jgi:hypothetical protein